jgi:hypothetical protein
MSILFAPKAFAHTAGNLYLEVVETSAGAARARFVRPLERADLTPRFGSACSAAERARADDGRLLTLNLEVVCSAGLNEVGISGLAEDDAQAVVFVERHDGTTRSALLTLERPDLRLSSSGRWLSPDEIWLGARHVLAGWDHLLFLALLVLSLGRLRSILLAESTFTLAHMASFAATALGAISISPRAAEACIALSLLLLALDAGRGRSLSLSTGQVVLQPLVFGAVHGVGFASGLGELGAGSAPAASALLSFGLGLELAQLGFVLAAFTLLRCLERLRAARATELATIYAAGGLASFWLIERLLLIVSASGGS